MRDDCFIMKKYTLIGAVIASLFWAFPAQAQDTAEHKIPLTVEEMKEMAKPPARQPYKRTKSLRVPAVKHRVVVQEKTIRVSPGQSKTVPLSRNAASVIVANPAHATVFLDTPRMLVIMPRAPGATELTVLDAEGQIVLQKGVLVDGAGDDHVRIRRICGEDARDCEAQTIYYCPDNNCVEVATPEPDTTGNYPVVPVATSAGTTFDDFDDLGDAGNPIEPTGDNQ